MNIPAAGCFPWPFRPLTRPTKTRMPRLVTRIRTLQSTFTAAAPVSEQWDKLRADRSKES